jgi:hypothetical protein
MHRTPSGNFMPRNNSGLFSREPAFDCNICLDMPTDPVVTMCGHLFWYAARAIMLHSHVKQFVTQFDPFLICSLMPPFVIASLPCLFKVR